MKLVSIFHNCFSCFIFCLCNVKQVLLSTCESMRTSQTADKLWVSYSVLPDTIEVGHCILLDDGAVELKVLQKVGKDVRCRVMNTGVLGNKKGVNLPGAMVALPAMSEKDKKDIR